MAFEWPDISQNQLFHAGLGLLGSGFNPRGSNPFQAASQGLVYGKQVDRENKEQERLDDEAARRKRLEDAWAGMFGAGGPAPDMAGPQSPPQPGPIDLTGPMRGSPAAGPQMADASGSMAGMGSQPRQELPPLGTEVVGRTPEGRPMIANPDGSFSTERSITVQAPDGRWVNIPSMFGGKQLPDDQAVAIMQRNGWKDPETGRPAQFFNSVQEAEAAARARSNSIANPSQGRIPQGNPMLANIPQQAMPLLAALGPEKGAPFLMQAMMREPKERRIVKGADGYNYYADTGERVIPGAEKPPKEPPAGYRYGADGNLEADPGWLAAQLKLRQAGASNTTVKLPPEQDEEAKAVGKYYGEVFTNLQQGAMDARSQNARLDRMDQLLEGVFTGKTAPTTQAIKATAKSLGIDLESLGITDDVGPAEAAQALSSQMALQLRNPAGGAGMPGAMSDKDRDFLQSMVPGLATSPEGRKLMIETEKRLNNRSIEVARMARAYRKRNERLDEGFFDELDAYSQENPLFDDLEPIKPVDLPPPAERTIGGFYQTPKGRAMWDGEGWIREQDVPGAQK